MNSVEALNFFRQEDLKDYLEAQSLILMTRSGNKLEEVSLHIEENQSLLCDIGEIYGPLDLYVSVHQNWNSLEQFMLYIGEFYREKEELPDIQMKHLHVGGYVALLYKDEWHRGKVLYLNEDKAKCQVQLVDYGTRVIENPASLKILHPNAFSLMAQAIHCRLAFPERILDALRESIKDPALAPAIMETLTQLISEKKLIVTFKKLVKEQNDEFIWEIDVHIPVDDDPEIMRLDNSGLLQHTFISVLSEKRLV